MLHQSLYLNFILSQFIIVCPLNQNVCQTSQIALINHGFSTASIFPTLAVAVSLRKRLSHPFNPIMQIIPGISHYRHYGSNSSKPEHEKLCWFVTRASSRINLTVYLIGQHLTELMTALAMPIASGWTGWGYQRSRVGPRSAGWHFIERARLKVDGEASFQQGKATCIDLQ